MVKKRTGAGFAQVYWPNCGTCNYMRKHPDFRLRVMQSTYFNPAGTESLTEVVRDFGDALKVSNVYMHIKRHQPNDLVRAREKFLHRANDKGNVFLREDARAPGTPIEAVEGDVMLEGDHEATLDEFIKEGREKLLSGAMPITAATLLNAIKIRADINKSTKDRRLEMVKAFFSGGGEKGSTDG